MAKEPTVVLSPEVRALIAPSSSPVDSAIAFEKAFALLGLPRAPRDPIFARPSELTKEQRYLAELVVERKMWGVVGPMPGGPAARRWLGVDPPGPFEREMKWKGERMPLWLALQRERGNRDEVLLALPPAERLEAIAAFEGGEDYQLGSEAWTWDSTALASLKGEGGKWARATLDAAKTDQPPGMPAQREHIAFLVAVRAGVAILPKWERFFPIGNGIPENIGIECAAAFPLERMEAIVRPRLGATHGHHAIQVALALLRHHDSPVIAQFVLEKSEKSAPHNRKAERAELAKLAATKPAVAALLKGKKSTVKERVLTVSSRLAPRAEKDLTPMQAKQLIEAGRRWDGKKLPALRRLSLDENDEAAMGAVLEHVTLSEDGRAAFDAWLVGGDSGTFFTTGTTKVIAERQQGGIVLEGKPDPALEEALSSAGASKKAVRSVAAVRKATKPLTKKKTTTKARTKRR